MGLCAHPPLPLFSDWEAVVRLTDGFNGADVRNVCSEAGMMAIREERDYVTEADFLNAAVGWVGVGRAGDVGVRVYPHPPSPLPCFSAQDGRGQEARVQARVQVRVGGVGGWGWLGRAEGLRVASFRGEPCMLEIARHFTVTVHPRATALHTFYTGLHARQPSRCVCSL